MLRRKRLQLHKAFCRIVTGKETVHQIGNGTLLSRRCIKFYSNQVQNLNIHQVQITFLEHKLILPPPVLKRRELRLSAQLYSTFLYRENHTVSYEYLGIRKFRIDKERNNIFFNHFSSRVRKYNNFSQRWLCETRTH